ncbi:MAG: efflux RND transporter permease subunit [Polyangiaceae bacterium]|nr:efflux RND transporter permease subunit [Polyangiaceae bacterium]
MIARLVAASIENRALVFLLTLVFALVGLAAARALPIDAVPDVTNVQVQVQTSCPALGPLDVESNVTLPVELAMGGLPGLEQVRSVSRTGISVVTVVFREGTELHQARQLVAQRVEQVAADIPEEVGRPQLGPISTGLGEVFHFEVRGDDTSLMDRRAVLDWQIAPRLRMLEGVTEVNAFGGEARAYEVQLDPARMVATRVDASDVVRALSQNHSAAGGAYYDDDRERVLVRGDARVRSLSDLEHVIVAYRSDRTPVYVRDVGRAAIAPIPRHGAVTRDGEREAVVGVAVLLQGANSYETVKRIEESLADVSRSLPKGVTIEPYYKRTDLVARTVHTVATNLLEASALVAVLLLVLLGSLRAGGVVAIAIPLALLAAFLGMWAAGVPGNLMSLGAIDFGLVVDGAIIIVENAERHITERATALGRPLTGKERGEAVLAAACEVRTATAFGEGIIALVYLPILTLEGVEGRMFRPMALTVLFALAGAFVLSLTVVPALASVALSLRAHTKESLLIRAARRAYLPSLSAALRRPVLTASIAAAGLVASGFAGARLGREFMPRLDEGTFVLAMVRLPSVSLPEATRTTMEVERLLRTFPEVTSVISRTGRAEIAVDPMGINMTDVYVMLKPKEQWTSARDSEGLVKVFDDALTKRIPGASFAYTQPIEMNTSDLLAGISADVAVNIYGDDLSQLKVLADKVHDVLAPIPGAADVQAEAIAGLNSLDVRVDRAAVARYGVDAASVMTAVEAIGGKQVGVVYEGQRRVPLQVRFAPEARAERELIAALPVRAPGGAMLPLSQLATLSENPGPSSISRERLQRRVTVQANVRGRDLASFMGAAERAVTEGVPLPTGYSYEWVGEFQRLQSAEARLKMVVPVTLLLILVLLVASFGKVRPAILIFLNIPVAATGGVLALWARGLEFSISAGVGFIALFGVAVLNGLVLVTSIERLRADGLGVDEAVRQGAEGRLRAVLTTALVASIGFLPMALSRGAGAEVQRPLATVVIGGILTATLLTLLVLPAMYTLLERWRRRAPDA